MDTRNRLKKNRIFHFEGKLRKKVERKHKKKQKPKTMKKMNNFKNSEEKNFVTTGSTDKDEMIPVSSSPNQLLVSLHGCVILRYMNRYMHIRTNLEKILVTWEIIPFTIVVV
jgi:hypothetical protein